LRKIASGGALSFPIVEIIPKSNRFVKDQDSVFASKLVGQSDGGVLGAELAEVMVQMFVHQYGPLVWRQTAEEGMGMRGASFGPGLAKTVD
jgi:hypothetical protein